MSKHAKCVCAECEKVRKDAARFQYLQNSSHVWSQSLFWNFTSRRERAEAIDKAIAARKP